MTLEDDDWRHVWEEAARLGVTVSDSEDEDDEGDEGDEDGEDGDEAEDDEAGVQGRRRRQKQQGQGRRRDPVVLPQEWAAAEARVREIARSDGEAARRKAYAEWDAKLADLRARGPPPEWLAPLEGELLASPPRWAALEAKRMTGRGVAEEEEEEEGEEKEEVFEEEEEEEEEFEKEAAGEEVVVEEVFEEEVEVVEVVENVKVNVAYQGLGGAGVF